MATELINSFNYTIKNNDWKPLTDIMGQDYETQVGYIIYINGGANGLLGFTQRTVTPEQSDRGREYGAGKEINITADNGDIIYLRANGSPINIEVREVEAQEGGNV